MKRVALGLAAVVPLLGACGDEDDDGAEPPTTATTAAATATLPTDPADYAIALVAAWETGDATTARRLATGEAFDALFAHEGGGAGTWHLVGCEAAAEHTACTFNAGGDPTVVVRVLDGTAAQAAPDAVTEVLVSSP